MAGTRTNSPHQRPPVNPAIAADNGPADTRNTQTARLAAAAAMRVPLRRRPFPARPVSAHPRFMTPAAPPVIAWVGTAAGAELAWARRALAELAVVHDFDDAGSVIAAAAGGTAPAVVILASDVSSRWPLEHLTSIARRWPLAPLVSVAASLVDGRRRSGPPLPAAEEVPWNELPARLACWLADRAAGRPGTLGLPVTARREDRAIEAAMALRPTAGPPTRVSVAAERAVDLEGLADLVATTGRDIVRRVCGRPPLDEPADALVWDAGAIDAAHLAWLRMLAANRPDLATVMIDSFPRADTVAAAIQAGARAVLGRPVSPEALAGALSGLSPGRATGIGRPGHPD